MIIINDIDDLFDLLTIALPYEYSEHLTNGTSCADTIEITKEGTDTVLYIAEDADEPLTFTAALYASADDDEPLREGIRWDTALENTTVGSVVKKLF